MMRSLVRRHRTELQIASLSGDAWLWHGFYMESFKADAPQHPEANDAKEDETQRNTLAVTKTILHLILYGAENQRSW